MTTDLSELRAKLPEIAQEISSRLEHLQTVKIVLAESCTAGLIAATLGGVPGISRYLCGSAVTYRVATKTAWLGIQPETITEHTAESVVVSRLMSAAAIQRTPEATLSLAITGHLGPGVDQSIDGRIFLAVSQRIDDGTKLIQSKELRLKTGERIARQTEATLLALECLNETLKDLMKFKRIGEGS